MNKPLINTLILGLIIISELISVEGRPEDCSQSTIEKIWYKYCQGTK